MTTCGSRVSFFKAGFLWLFNMRSSCQRHPSERPGAAGAAGAAAAAADTHLSGLVHLADHGADHVVSVVDEGPSVSVASPLAVHGFPPRQHDVKVRHEAAAADKHLHQSPPTTSVRSSDVGPEETLEPGCYSLLTAALQALVRV